MHWEVEPLEDGASNVLESGNFAGVASWMRTLSWASLTALRYGISELCSYTSRGAKVSTSCLLGALNHPKDSPGFSAGVAQGQQTREGTKHLRRPAKWNLPKLQLLLPSNCNHRRDPRQKPAGRALLTPQILQDNKKLLFNAVSFWDICLSAIDNCNNVPVL